MRMFDIVVPMNIGAWGRQKPGVWGSHDLWTGTHLNVARKLKVTHQDIMRAPVIQKRILYTKTVRKTRR